MKMAVPRLRTSSTSPRSLTITAATMRIRVRFGFIGKPARLRVLRESVKRR
jgi:hypothetical protein